MKTRKKLLWKLMFFSAVLCAWLLMTGKETHAASEWVRIPWGINVGDYASVRAGGYYFWCNQEQTGPGGRYTIYRAKTEDYENGERVYTFKENLRLDIYTNGEKFFMMDEVEKKGRMYAWMGMTNVEGSGKIKVLMNKRDRTINYPVFYGDTLYFAYNEFSVIDGAYEGNTKYTTYAMKIGEKAVKKVLKGYVPIKTQGRYLIVQSDKGSGVYSVYDTKTRKTRKLASQVASNSLLITTDKYFYYAVEKQAMYDKKYTYNFYRKKLNGSGKAKKLGRLELKRYPFFYGINDKCVVYDMEYKKYEYNFKTRKTKKINS
ncbi:MAG TPA: hypothetical protein DF613_16285 [Lachnospiraceae bacterium]|nr:hypothetical protein [Lachnospiraceae bacterium]